MLNARRLEVQPRIRNPRVARVATQTRVRHHATQRYAAIVHFSLVLGTAVVLLIAYVMLTSNLTGMTYAVSRAQAQRTDLQEQTARLDDRLTQMESQQRLSVIAARLGMRDPQEFAIVHLPPPAVPDDSRIAFLTQIGIR